MWVVWANTAKDVLFVGLDDDKSRLGVLKTKLGGHFKPNLQKFKSSYLQNYASD